MHGYNEPSKDKLWRDGAQRGTEIYGFVGSAWHSLPLLMPCDRPASPVQCQLIGTGGKGVGGGGRIDATLWMNALSRRLTSLARLWLFVSFQIITHGEMWFSFCLFIIPTRPLVLCRALTRQSTWGDYVGYLDASTLRTHSFWNAARAEIDFAFIVFVDDDVLFWSWSTKKDTSACLFVCLSVGPTPS